MLLKVRPADGSDSDEVSDFTALDCSVDGRGRTKQEFAEECDINTIIHRFGIGYAVSYVCTIRQMTIVFH